MKNWLKRNERKKINKRLKTEEIQRNGGKFRRESDNLEQKRK